MRCDTRDAAPYHTRHGWHLTLGPPGTGKTTRLLEQLERELESCGPASIAVVTFTRAARAEARDRAVQKLNLDPADLPWIRTIHSAAFRLLGLGKEDVLTPKHWREFEDRYQYEFSKAVAPQTRKGEKGDGDDLVEDEPNEPSVQTEDDKLLAILGWGRSRMLEPKEALAQAPFTGVDEPYFLEFVKRYDDYRAEVGKVDFYDMLERALAQRDLRPPVNVAFIDEAQDLSPLQVALVEQWFQPCERVYVAGDDDQAIYAFMGGDPSWLIKLSKECPSVDVLEQSYRVPFGIWAVAQRIVSYNADRVKKDYWPREDAGRLEVIELDELPTLLNRERTFILARNWYLLEDVARLLRRHAEPFRLDKHASWSVYGYPKILRAAKAAIELYERRPVRPRAFEDFIKLVPSRSTDVPEGIPRGTKKRAEENNRQVSRRTMEEWGLDSLLELMDQHGPISVMTRIPKDKVRLGLDALYQRWGELPEPHIELMSMHASKGREAESVFVLSEMSRKSHESYAEGDEAENRIAYVAVTRSKRRLVVVTSVSRYQYPFASVVSRVMQDPPRLREPGEDDPDASGYSL